MEGRGARASEVERQKGGAGMTTPLGGEEGLTSLVALPQGQATAERTLRLGLLLLLLLLRFLGGGISLWLWLGSLGGLCQLATAHCGKEKEREKGRERLVEVLQMGISSSSTYMPHFPCIPCRHRLLLVLLALAPPLLRAPPAPHRTRIRSSWLACWRAPSRHDVSWRSAGDASAS